MNSHPATTTTKPLTKEEAITVWRTLVARYGLRWGPSVPTSAWDAMNEVNKVLTERDRRQALGLPDGGCR